MARLLLILTAILLYSPLFAQNLVPNPSFEEYLECPDGFPDLDGKCQDWMSFRLSPDYFNNCSPTTGWDSWHGYQESHSGIAHAGILTFQTTWPNAANEHIGVQLTSPMIEGQKYYVSFHVSMAYEPTSLNVATNKIGALFTTEQYLQDHPLNPGFLFPANEAHIYTDEIISDTINWVKISGSIIADSSYEYLVIGNFFEDILLDTLQLENVWGPNSSYYYVDDVCVTTDSLFNETWPTVVSLNEIRPDNKLTLYPNPSNNIININCGDIIYSIDVFNSLGQHRIRIDKIGSNFLSIPFYEYGPGQYILKVNLLSESQFIRIVII